MADATPPLSASTLANSAKPQSAKHMGPPLHERVAQMQRVAAQSSPNHHEPQMPESLSPAAKADLALGRFLKEEGWNQAQKKLQEDLHKE